MTAMLKARTKSVRFISRDSRPLAANAKVFANALAYAIVQGTSRGFYAQATPAANAVCVGWFREDVDNTGGADGAKSAEIEFFADRRLLLLANDAGTAVLAADRESACYVKDDQTVTGARTATSEAGVVYDVTSEGVWVEIVGQHKAKRTQRGTGTLVAGVLVVTGVALRADSAILVTMKDAGAGAITGFADFRVPAADRNVAVGSFKVEAIDAAKAVIATAVCTFDWAIVDD